MSKLRLRRAKRVADRAYTQTHPCIMLLFHGGEREKLCVKGLVLGHRPSKAADGGMASREQEASFCRALNGGHRKQCRTAVVART